MVEISEKDISPQTQSPTPSDHEGEVYILSGGVESHGDGELQRTLSQRLIHVRILKMRSLIFVLTDMAQIISLGSQIGSGLFIATGKALHNGIIAPEQILISVQD